MKIRADIMKVLHCNPQDTKTCKASSDLRAPSLVQGRKTRNTSKDSTNKVANRGIKEGMGRKENKAPESKIMVRGLGRWSFRQPNQKKRNDEATQEQVDDGKNKEMKSQRTKSPFQRTWSDRRLSLADNNMGPTKTSIMKAKEENEGEKKMKSISLMKK